MEILSADEHGVRTLRLIGNFEPFEVARFEALIDESIAAGHVQIVIDAAHVQLVCSAALSAFLRAQVILSECGGDLVFAQLPHFATTLFHTLGLDRRIHCTDTVAQGAEFYAAS